MQAIARAAMLLAMRFIFLLLALLALAACASAAPPHASENVVDYTCSQDADCTIKNVGNCCGYYPACVNRESPTFAKQMQAECAKKGLASVCGFPVIHACACVQGRCAASDQGSGGEIR